MTAPDYRIESTQPIAGRLWSEANAQQGLSLNDRALAVSLAAKTLISNGEIRVVHVPTGEVVFRKPAAHQVQPGDEF